MDKMIMDKMIIDLNVFSSFMEDIIVSNMNGTIVVTIKRSAAEDVDTPKSLRSHHSQRSSDVVSARVQYFAAVLEQATWVCFLLRQEFREEPRKKQ